MIEDLDRAVALLERIDHKLGKPAGSNENASASTINVNAGGVWHAAAVWIASLCSVVSLLALVLGAIGVSHYIAAQDDKLSRMQDYLNAIYSIAPQLKPKDNP